MYKKILIVLVTVSLLYSCAIHDKFPFICFRWECIASELKLPKINTTGMKKQMRAKASIRKKKRQRAKNKRLAEKGIARNGSDPKAADPEESQQKPDSLKYRFKALAEDRYVIVSFNKKEPLKTDSIFIRYNEDGDDILEYDKQIIKNYLDSATTENITLIRVREHYADKQEEEQRNRHASTVKEHVAQYFVKFGIAREKIKTMSR